MTAYRNNIWPTQIKLKKADKALEVEFDDGTTFTYSAEYLRVESPSAEVRGHGQSHRPLVTGCRRVNISGLERVGNYAVRIIFDDQHDSGIYSWDYLYDLGEKQDDNWYRYLKMLDSLGLSRDDKGRQ